MAAPATSLPGFVEGVRATAAQFTGLTTLIRQLYARAMGGFRTRRPACVAHSAASIPLPVNTDVVLAWDTVDRDDGGMISAGDAAITCPVDGWYRVGMSVCVPNAMAAATGLLTGRIIPTSPVQANARGQHTTLLLTPRTCLSVSAVLPCTAGTPIYFTLRQTGTAATTTSPLFGGCRVWGYWVAPLGNTDPDDTPPPPPAGSGGLGVAPLGTAPLGA